MIRSLTVVTLILSAFLLVGCEKKVVVIEVPPTTPIPEPVAKTKTMETSRLGAAVDAYEQRPEAGNLAGVKKALADLDGEIAELEGLVARRTGDGREEAAVKLRNLQKYRAAEVTRLNAAQVKAPLTAPPPADGRTGAEKMEDSARRVGNSVEDAARKTGDAIKDAVR